MKRLLAVAVATATTATLALSATPANAAARPGVVKASEVSAAHGVTVTGSVATSKKVGFLKTCSTVGSMRVKKAKIGSYQSADAALLVSSHAYAAKSAASAKKLFNKAKFSAVCSSRRDQAGATFSIKKIAMPKLGTTRAALLVTGKSTNPNVAMQVTSAFYIVRKKNTVVVYNVVSSGKQNFAVNKRMIKKAVKRA